MDALRLNTAVIAGAAAGDHTVTGIKKFDLLISVQRVDAAAANLDDEFTVSADNTINNTGGTNTTGQTLLIMWYEQNDYRDLTSSSVGGTGRSPY